MLDLDHRDPTQKSANVGKRSHAVEGGPQRGRRGRGGCQAMSSRSSARFPARDRRPEPAPTLSVQPKDVPCRDPPCGDRQVRRSPAPSPSLARAPRGRHPGGGRLGRPVHQPGLPRRREREHHVRQRRRRAVRPGHHAVRATGLSVQYASGAVDEPYCYGTDGLSANRFRGGDTITGLTGVMQYAFDRAGGPDDRARRQCLERPEPARRAVLRVGPRR